MSLRERSFQFVENNSNYVVHVTRGQQRRRFEVSRLALFGGAALLSLVGAAVLAAAGYLVFRDDLLAGLIDRQTQMQYAYEDRLAAARLRLDQAGQQVVAEHQIARGGDHGRADQRQQGGSAEQSEARNLEAAALLAARHVHDVIRIVLDELKRPLTQGHVTFPGRRYAAGDAVPGPPRPPSRGGLAE